MKTENQIIRIPHKYWELFETMNDCDCGKLCKALFSKNPENLSGLALTYFNIIIVDIENIEKQVNIWKKYWKLGAEHWKKGWRPKKENPGGGFSNNPQDKTSKDKIRQDKIKIESKPEKKTEIKKELKQKISFKEILHSEIFQNEKFMKELWEKYSENILKQEMVKFISHRTEKSPNWKKEKWEKEKTFDIKRRFKTTWMWNFEKFWWKINNPVSGWRVFSAKNL